jgi:hypothetical protein
MSTDEPAAPNYSPSMQVMRLLWPGAVAVQAIYAAAKLGLADLVADGPKTAAELAVATKTDGASLGRLLRALSSLEIFAGDVSGRYRQTLLSDALRSGHPESIRSWAMMLGAGFVWRPCGELAETIRTGRPAFELVYDAPLFEYLADHREAGAIFDAAMSSLPSFVAAIVEAYDFSRFERVVDVGGGRGALLFGILAANLRARGVLHDLPTVVAGAAPRGPLADRCEIVGGNFFEGVPAGGDAYVLSKIVHDWDNASAAKILRNCRRAIRPDGTLLLIETVLGPSSDPAGALMDVLMMVLTGGRERTESEFRQLLRDAGFSLERVIPAWGASILESKPV